MVMLGAGVILVVVVFDAFEDVAKVKERRYEDKNSSVEYMLLPMVVVSELSAGNTTTTTTTVVTVVVTAMIAVRTIIILRIGFIWWLCDVKFEFDGYSVLVGSERDM